MEVICLKVISNQIVAFFSLVVSSKIIEKLYSFWLSLSINSSKTVKLGLAKVVIIYLHALWRLRNDRLFNNRKDDLFQLWCNLFQAEAIVFLCRYLQVFFPALFKCQFCYPKHSEVIAVRFRSSCPFLFFFISVFFSVDLIGYIVS